MVFIFRFLNAFKIQFSSLPYQVKRKQALLESNLSGMRLMVNKNVNSRGYHRDSPLIFLETLMP